MNKKVLIASFSFHNSLNMKGFSLIFLAVCIAYVTANNPVIEPLVVGGHDAKLGQFPYQVSVSPKFQFKSSVFFLIFQIRNYLNIFIELIFDVRFHLDLFYSDNIFAVHQF